MNCVCGYCFSTAALEKPKPYRSFAIIDDAKYRYFLRAEVKAYTSRDLGDIAKASRYVGTLMLCPHCGVATVNWPGHEDPVTYFQAVAGPGEAGGMDPEAFRTLALALPETTEEPHFEKTSFRVRKKIFATMAPEKAEAVVKLTPDDQQIFCGNSGGALQPVPGKWGAQGWTIITLEAAPRSLVDDVLTRAFCTVAPRTLARLVGG